MENIHFQIQFIEKLGGSYEYFEAPDLESAKIKAEETANNYLAKQFENDKFWSFRAFHTPFKPLKTARVVEYDEEEGEPKRGGIKFKLKLNFIKAKFKGGGEEANYWYKAE